MDIRKELIEGITQELIKFLIEEGNYDLEKAMEIIYNSTTLEKVADVETGLYKESSSYVFEILKDELKDGTIIQKEQ